MKKIICLLLMTMFLTACPDDSSDLVLDKIESEVSLVAVGDNLIHETVYQAAQIGSSYDFRPMYAEIKPYLQTFDLRFINQETILGGKEIGLSSYPAFNSPQELGDALVDTGFNLVSIANNHTLDRGEKAVVNAVRYWNRQPVIYSGASDRASSQTKVFSKKGIRFAYIAYTYGTNGIPLPKGKTYLANIYSDEVARRDIMAIKNETDFIIVSMHWGTEYQDFPNRTQINQAKFLSGLGVDLIIGHHPHVIEPVDMIENDQGEKTFVIYSLGNLMSDQKGTDRLIGMAASIDFVKTEDRNGITYGIRNPQAKLLYRYKNYTKKAFNVKMFEDIDESFLINYQLYFDEKKKLIQTYYPDIDVS